MEAEAKYTYVGIALIALVAALIAATVWLNRSGARGDFKYYTIYFERQPLDGLQIGADVDMRGIKIGRVEDYDLLAEKINRVRVTIRTDRRAPVRTNTVAIVTRNFVTGIARI
ncbi:MAG: MlaD family protein, partial [Burkholderiaceae bacterium]